MEISSGFGGREGEKISKQGEEISEERENDFRGEEKRFQRKGESGRNVLHSSSGMHTAETGEKEVPKIPDTVGLFSQRAGNLFPANREFVPSRLGIYYQ